MRERAEKALERGRNDINNPVLDTALDHLTLARTQALAARAGESVDPADIETHFAQAVKGLRDSGNQDDLPRGLLHRAAWHQDQGRYHEAARDLKETLGIAERGHMRLHEADAHLGLAVLEGLPVLQRRAHWEKARALIEECGYGVRRGRLARGAEKLL